MPYEKRYKTVVPIPLPADYPRPETMDDLLAGEGHPDLILARWLGRESFEKTAAEDRLDLVEYHERIVPLEDVNPTLAELLGQPIDTFVWFEFSGLGRLDQDAFDYFAAEFQWKCEEWLRAEREHLAALDEAATAGGA